MTEFTNNDKELADNLRRKVKELRETYQELYKAGLKVECADKILYYELFTQNPEYSDMSFIKITRQL